MYGSPEDGGVAEGDLSCILKTALGVAELTVTDLFRAIDEKEKGTITFGEWRRGHLPQQQSHGKGCGPSVSPGDQGTEPEPMPLPLTRLSCPLMWPSSASEAQDTEPSSTCFKSSEPRGCGAPLLGTLLSPAATALDLSPPGQEWPVRKGRARVGLRTVAGVLGTMVSPRGHIRGI